MCTVSVLFIALHTPLEHTVGPLYCTHLCYTEIFSYELDLFVLPFVQILHVGSFLLALFMVLLRVCIVSLTGGVREREQNPKAGLDECV